MQAIRLKPDYGQYEYAAVGDCDEAIRLKPETGLRGGLQDSNRGNAKQKLGQYERHRDEAIRLGSTKAARRKPSLIMTKRSA